MQNSARRPPAFGLSPRTWAIGPPLGSYESTSTTGVEQAMGQGAAAAPPDFDAMGQD